MPLGRPPKFDNVEDLERRIDIYFAKVRFNQYVKHIGHGDSFPVFLEAYQEGLTAFSRELDLDDDELRIIDQVEEARPLVCGLAMALGLSRQGLIEYQKKGDFSDTVKMAKLRIEAYVENSLYEGLGAGPIFNLKNNFNWRDERSSVLTLKSHEEFLDELADNETTGGQNDS